MKKNKETGAGRVNGPSLPLVLSSTVYHYLLSIARASVRIFSGLDRGSMECLAPVETPKEKSTEKVPAATGTNQLQEGGDAY